MTYLSTKTYGHEQGISCAFRQWRAESHCAQIHGYALSFKFIFSCEQLDKNNWCIDFGSLKSLKKTIEDNFDHKLLVAHDDPMLDEICALSGLGIANVLVVDTIGCEAFSQIGYDLAEQWLNKNNHSFRVKLLSCTVAEHGANSAIYTKASA